MFTKFHVWNNIIVIPWDKRSFPSELNQLERAHAMDDPDVLIARHWPYLRGYAKWGKRLGAFILSFSKQNLVRVKNQFPSITPDQGFGNIQQLKSYNSNLMQLCETVAAIKAGPLPAHNYKMPPIAEYQHRGTYLLTHVPIVPLFSDCGTGKSYMVLVSTEQQIRSGAVSKGKTLICVKLATIENCWVNDTAKFTDMKIGVLWSASKTKKAKAECIAKLNDPSYDLFVINHDGCKTYEAELIAHGFEKVVVDESTILKSFHGLSFKGKGGVLGKCIMHIAASARWRVIMSGTPAPNSIEDLWGQFNFLDPKGVFFEGSIHDFRRTFMEEVLIKQGEEADLFGKPASRDLTKWVQTDEGVKASSRIVDAFAYRVRIRDHIHNLPPLTIIKRSVEMDKIQEGHYDDLEEALLTVIDDETVETRNKLAQLAKLRQITGGFLIDHKEVAHAIDKNPKLDMLDQLLNEEIDVANNKVIIYAQYRWEIETIESRYKGLGVTTVYGGNASHHNLANINSFINNNDIRIIVLHPKSAAHGITLTNAHYMIFYSISYSAEDNYQCIKRIERNGQKEAMFVYYLLCKGSIDTVIYRAVQNKISNQANVIDQETINTDIVTEYRNERKNKALSKPLRR